jgi:dephospho-CoA kinase
VLNVALTGNVASGKSAVADLWTTVGVPLVSADALARQAVEPGSAGLSRVVERFGAEMLLEDGRLDRAALRSRVFADAEARRDLEGIIHPIVWSLRARWLEAQRGEGARLVVSEIPLLFETGREEEFDVVVLVDAPLDVRVERMIRDRSLEPEEARRIAASQMDPASKRAGSHHVIDNEGSLHELEASAFGVLEAIRAMAGLPVTLTLDLHLHTWGSWDCLSRPERILEAADAKGVSRIGVTDHNRLDVALEMAARDPDRVIPSEEVKTAEGIDVIGLYLWNEIPKGTPAAEVVARVREQGGIPYLPHPYAGGKGGGGRFAEELAPLVDVVEVFNGRIHKPALNERAGELARAHGALPGAGSDAHTLGEVGAASIRVPWHPNRPEGLRATLAHGEVRGRSSSYLVHLASTWAKIAKRLGAPGPA